VIVLSLAKKNRDADHLQNFEYDQCKGIDAARLAADLRKAPKRFSRLAILFLWLLLTFLRAGWIYVVVRFAVVLSLSTHEPC
jgi:hypothetical protein